MHNYTKYTFYCYYTYYILFEYKIVLGFLVFKQNALRLSMKSPTTVKKFRYFVFFLCYSICLVLIVVIVKQRILTKKQRLRMYSQHISYHFNISCSHTAYITTKSHIIPPVLAMMLCWWFCFFCSICRCLCVFVFVCSRSCVIYSD